MRCEERGGEKRRREEKKRREEKQREDIEIEIEREKREKLGRIEE